MESAGVPVSEELTVHTGKQMSAQSARLLAALAKKTSQRTGKTELVPCQAYGVPSFDYSFDFLSSDKALTTDVTMPTNARAPDEIRSSRAIARSSSVQPSKNIQTPSIAGTRAATVQGIGPRSITAIGLVAAVAL